MSNTTRAGTHDRNYDMAHECQVRKGGVTWAETTVATLRGGTKRTSGLVKSATHCQSEGVVAQADYGFPVCECWVGWTSQTISFLFTG